jgi:5-hydroxyisourate hydrolase
MRGISVHVVDVSRGIVAHGMQVALGAVRSDGAFESIAEGRIDEHGLLADPARSRIFPAGRYRVVFHVGAYYRACGLATAAVPFLDVVTYDFGLADPGQHIHLPFKCTPWGYSCFRGGA